MHTLAASSGGFMYEWQPPVRGLGLSTQVGGQEGPLGGHGDATCIGLQVTITGASKGWSSQGPIAHARGCQVPV